MHTVQINILFLVLLCADLVWEEGLLSHCPEDHKTDGHVIVKQMMATEWHTSWKAVIHRGYSEASFQIATCDRTVPYKGLLGHGVFTRITTTSQNSESLCAHSKFILLWRSLVSFCDCCVIDQSYIASLYLCLWMTSKVLSIVMPYYFVMDMCISVLIML